jgi:lipopolysaccharide transport system ATP-binding protein
MLLDRGQCLFLCQLNEAVERYYQIEHSQRQAIESNQCHYDAEIGPNGGLCETDVIDNWPPKNAFLDLSKAIVIGEKDIARCTGVALCNDKGQPCTSFQMKDVAYFYFEFEFLKDSDVPVGGVVVTNKMNINIHGKNSLQYLLRAPSRARKGTRVRFRQTIHLDIESGEYAFQVGLATINADDYARVTEMDAGQLSEKLRAILRVRQIGIISVLRNKEGLGIPFYGSVDLKGECTLSILDQNED